MKHSYDAEEYRRLSCVDSTANCENVGRFAPSWNLPVSRIWQQDDGSMLTVASVDCGSSNQLEVGFSQFGNLCYVIFTNETARMLAEKLEPVLEAEGWLQIPLEELRLVLGTTKDQDVDLYFFGQ